MEFAGILIAVIGAFLVFKFITGMVKFVVLGVILLAVFYFMTGGFGA
jgi:multisubunit Na+/H+ antiporter MnhG subunit